MKDKVLRGSVEETLEAGRTLSLPYSHSLCGGQIQFFDWSWTASKKRRKQRLVVPAYTTCLPASAATLPVACLSPSLESEQSRTSIDESGNRHREVLSKSWASSSVNWAVVSRAASMAWRMNQRRPEGIRGQSGRKENNTYNRLQSYVKIISKEL